MAASINYMRALLNLPKSNPERAGWVSSFEFERKIHPWGQNVSSEIYALKSGLYFIGYKGNRFVWGIVFRGRFEHEIAGSILKVYGEAHIMEYSKLGEHGSGAVKIDWEFKGGCDPKLSEALEILSNNLAETQKPTPSPKGLFMEDTICNFTADSGYVIKETQCRKVEMRELIRKDQSIIIALKEIMNERS